MRKDAESPPSNSNCDEIGGVAPWTLRDHPHSSAALCCPRYSPPRCARRSRPRPRAPPPAPPPSARCAPVKVEEHLRRVLAQRRVRDEGAAAVGVLDEEGDRRSADGFFTAITCL